MDSVRITLSGKSIIYYSASEERYWAVEKIMTELFMGLSIEGVFDDESTCQRIDIHMKNNAEYLIGILCDCDLAHKWSMITRNKANIGKCGIGTAYIFRGHKGAMPNYAHPPTRNGLTKAINGLTKIIVNRCAQQVDSAEASTNGSGESGASGSPR